MLKIPPQNKRVTKERGSECQKMGGLQVEKTGLVGVLMVGGGHGAKVATWHGH